MSRIDELLSEHFHRFERRGRGAELFDTPVALEPAFVPFRPYAIQRTGIDEGRRHTMFSGLLQRFADTVEPTATASESEDDADPEPFFRSAEELSEVQVSLSNKPPNVEALLRQIARGGELLSFELMATATEIVPQWVAPAAAVPRVVRAVGAYLPGAHAIPVRDRLSEEWLERDGTAAIAELCLGREFLIPLGDPLDDLLAGVTTAINGLGKEEIALFQVLFEPVVNPWAASMIASVSDDALRPFFVNRPDLLVAAKEKTSSPLFAVVVRLASKAACLERAWEILADMAAPLSALDRAGSNFFVPASNDDYPDAAHEWDVLNRLSRRAGMLLNMEEVVSLLTPPALSASPKLRHETRSTRPAPEHLHAGSLSLGFNVHAGISTEVFLSREQRVRHTQAVGATGTGKSTLLLALIRQDIAHDDGIAVFDPHGDLIETILREIPAHRINDVVLVDPSDEEYVVGLNVLTAHSDLERNLLASDLTSVFRRLSTSWGDQMESVLRNAILAFLESSRGGTLLDLRRFLIDQNFRREFLPTVADAEVVYYWTHAFPMLGGTKSIGPLLTRLDEFLSRKPIRYMMATKAIDFADVIDHGKIFLAKLPQGLIGRDNAHLLGSLIVSKFQQLIMARQRQAASSRRDFWMYLDEFHHFIAPSLSEILSGGRKYGVGLTLAHQELRQLKRDAEVESAVLSNCQTRIVFRVGDADARALAEGFASFEATDLQKLETGEAVCRVERSDFDFNLCVPFSGEDVGTDETREAVIAASRAKHARPRSEIEAELLEKLATHAPEPTPVPQAEVRKTEMEISIPFAEPSIAHPSIEPVLPAEVPQLKKSAAPAVPKELGKGGQQHKYLQHLIRKWAQDRGWLATVECPVKGGLVDVCLERGKRKIACEISVTTGAEQETANVRKCLADGFDLVALVVEKPRRISGLEKILREKISESDIERVRVLTAEGLCAFLDELDAQDASRTENVRGYKVKVKHRPVDDATREERMAVLTKTLAESLRNLNDA